MERTFMPDSARRRRRLPKGLTGGIALSIGMLLSCGDEATPTAADCVLDPLPLEGQAGAPTITDVGLEDQGGEFIVLHVTATDPQGSADLIDVNQTVGVFRNDRCEGTPISLQDDLAGSGTEETFGTVVDVATDPDLYSAIAGAETWPVELNFRDIGGNVVSGRVAARVFR